jgi:hypothetical protein
MVTGLLDSAPVVAPALIVGVVVGLIAARLFVDGGEAADGECIDVPVTSSPEKVQVMDEIADAFNTSSAARHVRAGGRARHGLRPGRRPAGRRAAPGCRTDGRR